MVHMTGWILTTVSISLGLGLLHLDRSRRGAVPPYVDILKSNCP